MKKTYGIEIQPKLNLKFILRGVKSNNENNEKDKGTYFFGFFLHVNFIQTENSNIF